MVSSHIVKSYDEDLNYLRHKIKTMSHMAIDQLKTSVDTVTKRDRQITSEIIAKDLFIDQIEHDIEAFAIRMIALRQPVAKDLRNIITALKVSNHLERIADYATNIAKRSLNLAEHPYAAASGALIKMSEKASTMIQDVVTSYLEGDDEQALNVWRRDQELDEMYTSYLRELLTYMMEEPRYISSNTQLLFMAKNIERIGDHTTNIAEMVYYLVYGQPFSEVRPKSDLE
ncbi:MAG: phosphate signaling complex protein PhoU [Janthinobacterium lividum]